MKIRTLSYALMMLVGCSMVNEVESAPKCGNITISFNTTNFKDKVWMSSVDCGHGPLEPLRPVKEKLSLEPGSRLELYIKGKPIWFFNTEINERPMHITCTDIPKPHCIPSQ